MPKPTNNLLSSRKEQDKDKRIYIAVTLSQGNDPEAEAIKKGIRQLALDTDMNISEYCRELFDAAIRRDVDKFYYLAAK